MRYETHFGGFTHWVLASTPIQAALLTFQECVAQCNTFPRLPIMTINLENGDEEYVGIADVLFLLNLSANCDLSEVEPLLDPDCDIIRAAKDEAHEEVDY